MRHKPSLAILAALTMAVQAQGQGVAFHTPERDKAKRAQDENLRRLRLAEEKVSGENLVRKALAGGMTTAEAFKKFGIL